MSITETDIEIKTTICAWFGCNAKIGLCWRFSSALWLRCRKRSHRSFKLLQRTPPPSPLSLGGDLQSHHCKRASTEWELSSSASPVYMMCSPFTAIVIQLFWKTDPDTLNRAWYLQFVLFRLHNILTVGAVRRCAVSSCVSTACLLKEENNNRCERNLFKWPSSNMRCRTIWIHFRGERKTLKFLKFHKKCWSLWTPPSIRKVWPNDAHISTQGVNQCFESTGM